MAARRSAVATWIRQSTGSNVSSETNSVSNPKRPADPDMLDKLFELGRRGDQRLFLRGSHGTSSATQRRGAVQTRSILKVKNS